MDSFTPYNLRSITFNLEKTIGKPFSNVACMKNTFVLFLDNLD